MQTKKTKKDESIKMIPETKAIRFWNRYSMLILIGLGMVTTFIGIVINRLAKKAHQNHDVITKKIAISKEIEPIEEINENEEFLLNETIKYKEIGQDNNGNNKVQFYEAAKENKEDFEEINIVSEVSRHEADINKVAELIYPIVEEILSTPTPQSDTSNDSE